MTNSAGAVDIRGAQGEQGEQGERGPAGTGGGGGGGTADGVLDGLSLSFAGYDVNGETTAILSASRSVGADITVDLSRLYQRADGTSIRGDGVSDNPFVVSIPNVVSSLQNLHGDARLDASRYQKSPRRGNRAGRLRRHRWLECPAAVRPVRHCPDDCADWRQCGRRLHLHDAQRLGRDYPDWH